MNDALTTLYNLLGLSHQNKGFKEGIIVTILIVGAYCGSLLAMRIVSHNSRRKLILITDTLFIMGCSGMMIVNVWVVKMQIVTIVTLGVLL